MQPRTIRTARWVCASLFAIATASACSTTPTRAYRAPDQQAMLPEREPVATPPKPEPPPAVASVPDSCPIKVPGTIVAVEDTSAGGTLVLTTTGDADQLRTSLYAMADGNNQMHAKMGALPAEGGGGVAVAGSADTGTTTDPSKSYGGTTGQGSNTIAGENKKPSQPTTGQPSAPVTGQGTSGVSDQEDLPQPSESIYASGGAKKAPPNDVGPLNTHSRARVESIAGGARIVFTAFPDDVAALQQELRARARSIERNCGWAAPIEGDLR